MKQPAPYKSPPAQAESLSQMPTDGSEKPLFNRFKKWLSNLIVSVMRLLNDWDLKITGHAENVNEGKFEDLGPVSDAKNSKVYEHTLLRALKKANTLNIAITGPYGSGKSSIIATFQRKHPEFKYLNVSLATFEENFKESTDWRQKVELSILQQLIYHERNSKLPDSRFRKIDHTTTTENILVTLFLIILGLCTFYIYKPEYIAKFSWWGAMETFYHRYIDF